jgi:hypothetical protein
MYAILVFARDLVIVAWAALVSKPDRMHYQ